MANRAKEDNILRSCYPWQDIPSNLSISDFLKQEAGDEILDHAFLLDVESGKEISRRHVLENSRCLSNALSEGPFDFKRGDFVAFLMPNVPEYLEIFLGVIQAGLVPVNFNPDDLENLSSSIKFKAVFTTHKTMETLMQKSFMSEVRLFVLVPESEKVVGSNGKVVHYHDLIAKQEPMIPAKISDGNELAFVIHSSGTSGVPKGLKVSHRNVIAAIKSWERIVAESYGSSTVTYFPFYNISGLSLLLRAFCFGYHLVSLRSFAPTMYLEALKMHKPSFLILLPSVMSLIASSETLTMKDFVQLKAVVTGGAPMRETVVPQFAEKVGKHVIIQSLYGSSEMFGFATAVPPRLAYAGHLSVGQVVPNMEMKLVSLSTGTALGPFERGEPCFRGDAISSGYLNNEEANKQAFDSEGWYHIGDYGYYDSNGLVYIVGRIKDLMVVGGEQVRKIVGLPSDWKFGMVSPEEIENVIRRLEMVKDVVVFGVEDDDNGEVPRALVVRHAEDLTEEQVMNIVQENLEVHKRLRGGVRFVPQLPMNAVGKVVRREAKTWDVSNRN